MEKIAYTVNPPEQLTQDEWAKEFKFGSQYLRKDLNAWDIQKQYHEDLKGHQLARSPYHKLTDKLSWS
jgi:hypothetical protein